MVGGCRFLSFSFLFLFLPFFPLPSSFLLTPSSFPLSPLFLLLSPSWILGVVIFVPKLSGEFDLIWFGLIRFVISLPCGR